MPARFARLGDLHAGLDAEAFRLDTLLEWADRHERDDPDGSAARALHATDPPHAGARPAPDRPAGGSHLLRRGR